MRTFIKAGALLSAVGAILVCDITGNAAQAPSQLQPAAPASVRPSAYPERSVADPKLADDGKNLFSVRCAFCHGSDARGGEGGPNLLHSQTVLKDQNGELIKPLVRNGKPAQGMPAFDLEDAQISALVAFLHSIPVSSHERTSAAVVIPVGDAKAGEEAFVHHCGSCHSASGDLRGIGARVGDPKTLQQTWLMPGSRGSSQDINPKPKQVKLTLRNRQSFGGKLIRMDDFVVTMLSDDGVVRSFERLSDKDPKVVVIDPLEGHVQLLPQYTDKSIHDITAYLESLK